MVLTRPLVDTTWERPVTWVDASVADATVSEATGGAFTVNLSAALPHDVTLDWSLAAGTADATDLPLGTGTVTVAAGATTATVPVGLTDDASDEDDETFNLILTDASHGIGLARSQATGKITDDDDPPSLSIEGTRVTEGHTSLTDAQLRVVLSAPSAKPVTFTYATADATASSPGDYGPTTATLHVPPGQTEAIAHVAVHGDTDVEPEETLTVTLSAPVNATLATASAEVTIVDDEALVLEVTSPQVTEGTGGTTPATFAVALKPPAPPGTQVTVDYRVEGLTATVPDDVNGASGTLTFGPGGGPQELRMAVHGDTTPEQTESFRLVLESPEGSDGRPVLIGDNPAAAIVDDDTVTNINTPPSCAAVAPTLTSLWPPNGKMVTVGVHGATEIPTATPSPWLSPGSPRTRPSTARETATPSPTPSSARHRIRSGSGPSAAAPVTVASTGWPSPPPTPRTPPAPRWSPSSCLTTRRRPSSTRAGASTRRAHEGPGATKRRST